jgi:hypothetical protein
MAKNKGERTRAALGAVLKTDGTRKGTEIDTAPPPPQDIHEHIALLMKRYAKALKYLAEH